MTTKFIRQGIWTCNGYVIRRRLAGSHGVAEFVFERKRNGKVLDRHESLSDAARACA